MDNKRSIGVSIFAFLGIIIGIYGLAGLIIGTLHHDQMLSDHLNVAFITIISSIFFIFLSYNLLRLRNWSRVTLLMLNMIFLLIPISIFIYGLTITSFQEALVITGKRFHHNFHSPLAVISFILQHIYFIGCIWFFTRPKVKDQFKALSS